MVIALNMMDEVRASGNTIDVEELQKRLGVPVIPISAGKNEGIADLVDAVVRTAKTGVKPDHLDFCTGEVHRAIHAIAHIIEDHAQKAGYPLRFAATKLVEGDEPTQKALRIHPNDIHLIDHLVRDMEEALGTDREAALADMRYSYIEELCKACVVKRGETREQLRSEKIDRILTHRVLSVLC